MAVDSWLPRRFASLSDRLTTKDGVLLMGFAAIGLLFLTRGRVDTLVVMYSINVFATFSLTEMAMCRHWITSRREQRDWKRHISVHVVGLILCLTILGVMAVEKFQEGAWKTLLITFFLIGVCAWARAHYRTIESEIHRLALDPSLLATPLKPGGGPDPNLP